MWVVRLASQTVISNPWSSLVAAWSYRGTAVRLWLSTRLTTEGRVVCKVKEQIFSQSSYLESPLSDNSCYLKVSSLYSQVVWSLCPVMWKRLSPEGGHDVDEDAQSQGSLQFLSCCLVQGKCEFTSKAFTNN